MNDFFSVKENDQIRNIIIDRDLEDETRTQLFHETGIKVVGIIGLGLIGASFAKAFKQNSDCKILAFNRTRETAEKALREGVIDEILDEDNISECDLIIPSLYPDAIIEYVKNHAKKIKKGAIVIDAGGLKRKICKELYPIAAENGFTFVGGHPMAGKKFSGYDYSTGDLYRDSSMIVVPETNDSALEEKLAKVFLPCRIGMLTVTNADKHDAMIAFTSEMPHIISNAFIKSPTAREHDGFSAGSYKDLTRVAWLNETMWTEIFLENRDYIIKELNYMIKHLDEYRKTLMDNDPETLWKLLHEGKIAKEEVDGI
ncbi:MAG: prephenate dehydrogenase/arogenate dehydrogenase family protein [Eubacterium sp.]|nr:prephenate dehydrogenase/arogenate dehydrogenase family protein [Eubacterium sp.]